jgi:hypothetical protein
MPEPFESSLISCHTRHWDDMRNENATFKVGIDISLSVLNPHAISFRVDLR